MKNSPIILFTYNRPQHTKMILESLSKCKLFKESKVYIFIDGPTNNYKDKHLVKKVRILIDNFGKRFDNVNIYSSRKNLGLFKNLTKGISLVLKKNHSAIILEDDLNLQKEFLVFMNKALNFYKNKKRVLQISGYNYPIQIKSNKTYLLNLTSCWGWGIWKDRWQEFENFLRNKNKINELYIKIKKDKKLKYKFNINDSFDYLKFLKKQININYNSWGVLFYLYSFDKKALNLFPPKSLVNNDGFDGSGLHKSRSDVFNSVAYDKKNSFIFEKKIYSNDNNLKKITSFLKEELSLYNKVKRIILG